MKRVVSAFLLVVVILGLLPIQASAIEPAGTVGDGIVYFLQDTQFPRYWDPTVTGGGTLDNDKGLYDGYWLGFITKDKNIHLWPLERDADIVYDALETVVMGSSHWASFDVGIIGWEAGFTQRRAASDALLLLYDMYMYLHPELVEATPYEFFSSRVGNLGTKVYVHTTNTTINWGEEETGELGSYASGNNYDSSDFANLVTLALQYGSLMELSDWGDARTVFPEDLNDVEKHKRVFPWFLGCGDSVPANTNSATGEPVSDVMWQSLLKTAPEKEQEALEDAAESLGDYPSTGSFFEQAEWSARYYVLQKQKGVETPDMSGFVTLDVVNSASEDQFGETHAALKKAYVQSIFTMLDTSPFKTEDKVTGPTDGGRLIDSATALSALRTYLNLDQTGQLDTSEQRMLAWKYKLQATMGLASGTLRVAVGDETGTALTKDELNSFIEVAYGSALAKDLNRIYGRVGYPRSAHLGEEALSNYYYYLVLCYQEYGYYATTLVNNLGPLIAQQQTSFSQRGSDIAALKSIYEALSWANDDALWDFWDSKNSEATFDGDEYKSLKAIYDYLLSVNAFDGISEYDPESVDSPLRYFFGDAETGGGGKSFSLSEDVKTGILASASFLPMKTNLYDPYTYSNVVDTEWLLNFHSKFGYNRKALYIDTNVDSAVNFQRTGTRGELKVCTLEDLLYADKDIVLYLDDNLYNVKELAELTDKAFDRLDNVDAASKEDPSLLGKLSDFVTGFFDVSMENIAKTAEVTTYSQKVRDSVANSDKLFGSTKWVDYFYTNEEAGKYLEPDKLWVDGKMDQNAVASSYTPLTAFAVLSAVYNDSSLFNTLNTVLNRNTPVFISSPTVPYLEEANDFERNQIYNYLLLKNLDSQMSVDYANNLDMTSPVYMDIYGNIVTESGIVVVPSAANATLWRSGYTPYNAAFYSTYGDDFVLEYNKDATELNNVLSNVLTPVDETEWQLTSVAVNGGSIDLSKLSTADKDSLAAVTEVFAYDLSVGGIYDQAKWEMIITEVLRGAPIEHIDKDFEGLNLSHRVTKNGLVVAEKLEFLVDALSSKGTNTTLSIPNPAYMDGIEYIVFFAFKILILAILVIWMVTIYVDAVGGGVNLRTGLKCIGAVVLVLSLIVGVPAAFEVSYYQSNKLLLQNETEYLMMLNLEKRESGQEIGITSVHEPDTNTTLYLKLADIDIPWYDLLPKIITSSTANNLEALYADYEGQHPVASAEGVTVINDAVYISTDQLFDSSSISFSPTLQKIWQQSSGDTPASYYTPYYYFLENLIFKANKYSSDNEYYSYTTKVQRGGKLKTLGYVQPYFTSEQFMEEGMDYFGLYTLYDVTPPMLYTDEALMSDAEIEAARGSQWCNMNLSEKAKQQRIEKLNEYARKWVADHKELLGKVTDETFLKCFALSCAMEHNRLFNTLRADNLEIYELSNEDLMRLSIADHDTVMKDSTMSYARFVFSVGGTPAVYAAALLTLVNFVSSWVKPIATLIVFCITCISIFVFKLILRKSNNSIYGYICTILLMCSINVLGSVFLKLSMYIPSTGMSPTVCILIQILVQCAYIFALFMVIKTALKDWRNVGFERYNLNFNKLTSRHQHSVEVDTPKQKSGWDYYNALVERQRRRHRSL
ncbi:hypothetical protein [Flavonifractor plautii]|uniref:hypothetical protein n=1 Tax=Flavonifractor plautii TaxID=292800 RepID=UPI00189A3268|nr:hypothetical protein [Flavonifractor plautii]